MSLWEPALPRAWLPQRMICSGSNFWAISWAKAWIVVLSIGILGVDDVCRT